MTEPDITRYGPDDYVAFAHDWRCYWRERGWRLEEQLEELPARILPWWRRRLEAQLERCRVVLEAPVPPRLEGMR